MLLLGHAGVGAVGERGADVRAGARIAGDLEQHVLAQQEARARRHRRPVEALQREVLADMAGLDRMPLGPQGADDLQGEEAHRPLGTAVVMEIALSIASHAARRDLGGLYGALGHAAGRYADLGDAPGAHQSATSMPMFDATARS
jgi:hypothetical protein